MLSDLSGGITLKKTSNLQKTCFLYCIIAAYYFAIIKSSSEKIHHENMYSRNIICV